MTDNNPTPAKDGVGSHLSVRLDSRTDRQLAALVEHFQHTSAHPDIPVGAILAQTVSSSMVVRHAIRRLYEETLT